jgi:hypothetical protein
MGGGEKENMKHRADEHFAALRQIIPEVSRLMLFDYDEQAKWHPDAGNPSVTEWTRRNIENYLLVPPAWRRAVIQHLECTEDDLFAQSTLRIVDDFFAGENLTLPPGRTWRNVSANVFSVVDGKRLLFENDNSLFQQLRAGQPSVPLVRERVAMSMSVDEIHDDVHAFIGRLVAMTEAD